MDFLRSNTEYLAIGSSILSVILFFVILFLLYKVISLEKIRKQFYSSNLDRDLESVLVDQNRLLMTLNKELKKTDDNLQALTKLNENNFQKIGFIRFNPFDNDGGNISFALALLNARNDGIVISSLHGRDGTRVYSKSIKNGKSATKLTEEEKEAIEKAQ